MSAGLKHVGWLCLGCGAQKARRTDPCVQCGADSPGELPISAPEDCRIDTLWQGYPPRTFGKQPWRQP